MPAFTSAYDFQLFIAVLSAGGSGYLLKGAVSELLDAVRAVLDGQFVVGEEIVEEQPAEPSR